MRKELQRIGSEERHRFRGEFVRKGYKSGYNGSYPKETLLLVNIVDENGRKITDHLWFNYTKGFWKAHLIKGDIVEFHARVEPYTKIYTKGYPRNKRNAHIRKRIDYKLSYPTKIKNLG